jgi:hypothetical protein
MELYKVLTNFPNQLIIKKFLERRKRNGSKETSEPCRDGDSYYHRPGYHLRRLLVDDPQARADSRRANDAGKGGSEYARRDEGYARRNESTWRDEGTDGTSTSTSSAIGTIATEYFKGKE